MSSASDPRQPNRQGQPAPRPVQAGQRPVQPTQRPAQPSSHAARPAQRTTQQPTARTAQPSGGTRFKQQAPTQRAQVPQSQSHAHRAHGSRSVAPATRSSYNTHARRGAQKKSSPVPMIIGAVVAVLALVAIVFFVVPAVKGFFTGGDANVTAGQQVTITIPDGASGDTMPRFSPRTISSRTPRITTRRSKSSTPICRSSLALTRLPRLWMRRRSSSNSWRVLTPDPIRLRSQRA